MKLKTYLDLISTILVAQFFVGIIILIALMDIKFAPAGIAILCIGLLIFCWLPNIMQIVCSKKYGKEKTKKIWEEDV